MTETFNGLPVYQLEMMPEGDGLEAIALVDIPAIKKNFQRFHEKMTFAINEERRIVSGPVMIPDKLMFRDDKERGQYYVFFTKQMIEQINMKYFASGNIHSVNLMHDPNTAVKDIVMFESFLSDSSRGVLPMSGFDDCPEGTWFASFKVNNDAVWEMVKAEDFRGFSVEGVFNHQPVKEDITEEDVEALERMYAVFEKIIAK